MANDRPYWAITIHLHMGLSKNCVPPKNASFPIDNDHQWLRGTAIYGQTQKELISKQFEKSPGKQMVTTGVRYVSSKHLSFFSLTF